VKFFQENIFLIAIAFVSGGMLLWPLIQRRSAGPTLGNVAATRLINDRNALVVDVRTVAEFAAGHLVNAKNVPVEDLDKRIAELPTDKPLIITCAEGRSAGKAAASLRAAGRAEVFVLEGGLRAWREAGLPIVK
jgi:rhodanese-related sulfurtransferase